MPSAELVVQSWKRGNGGEGPYWTEVEVGNEDVEIVCRGEFSLYSRKTFTFYLRLLGETTHLT